VSDAEPIRVWDRARGEEVAERIFGAAAVRFLYRTGAGRFLAHRVLSSRMVSRITGVYWSSPLSRARITPFIRDYAIPMDEFEPSEYGSFNDFFIRAFRAGARSFCREEDRMPAFAEARYLAWDRIGPETVFPLKGMRLDAPTVLGGEDRARPFLGGPLLVARLCPVDYHRFHYPCDGTTVEACRLPGRLHSVNPVALVSREGVLAGNRRAVSLLQTGDFGLLAYVEVGAMGVGRIVQTHPRPDAFRRGDEKGYFLFGGSTVLLFGEPGRWSPDRDLLGNTGRGLETLVRLGDGIASRE
jgi:phosphatidylserine decarboxylase